MVGLLYDVHGNLPALEAVLADAGESGVDEWLLGGDFALFGGWPQETIELLETLSRATWIRGNCDRETADPENAPDDPFFRGAIAAVRSLLSDEQVARLGALPQSAELPDGSRAWHASPVSDMRSFLPDPQPEDAELLGGVGEPRLIFGHTHLPFARVDAATGIALVNPGSVGMPFDGNPRAAWAILHDDGTIEHRRTRYDHASAARRVRELARDEPWGEIAAKRIERAQFVAR
jgi:predicted phosphodiesterase